MRPDTFNEKPNTLLKNILQSYLPYHPFSIISSLRNIRRKRKTSNYLKIKMLKSLFKDCCISCFLVGKKGLELCIISAQ